MRLAEVLERAARGLEAADEYQAAAARARGFERIELEREAAEQLLHSGHLTESDEALGRILAAAGMRRPRTMFGRGALVALLPRGLRDRGRAQIEREARDVRPADHLRIEALYAAVLGLSFTNVLYGVCLQPRHLFLAFRAGDRFQVLRAAGIEAMEEPRRGGPSVRANGVRRDCQGAHPGDARSERARVLRGHVGVADVPPRPVDGPGADLTTSSTGVRVEPAGWHANAQLFASTG